MSTTGWAAVIIALIIVLGGAWWYMSSQAPAAAPTDTTATGTIPAGTTPDNGSVGGDTGTPTTGTTVHFTSTGFSPANVTIQAGQKVTFVNDTTGQMWVASDAHPTHTEFDGTDRAAHCSGTYTGPTPFDQCQNGSTYTFVFTKAGTFQFHNHLAAQFEGTVTVQ